MPGVYRFSFGPWNIHEGADPFGPTVRKSVAFAEKLSWFKELGFEAVMLHDDAAVPEMEQLTPAQITSQAAGLKAQLDELGLAAEIVAPRLWEGAQWVDGGFTANDPSIRAAAIERSKRTIDIANALGCNLMVLWLAREGTYIRESKSPIQATGWLLEALNAMLAYDPAIRIAIEPKPNEPMDLAYIPTIGHALALGLRSIAPERCGALVESAHAVLAGLDPSDEMGFALAAGKLWSVHLNDQNGLKYDQDKSFGSANPRSAFDQVRVLEEANYGTGGEMVAFDVKAMRTTRQTDQLKHLAYSREMFLTMVEKVRTLDRETERQLIAARDYEELDRFILRHLLGV